LKSQITRFVTESSAAFADLGTFLPLVLGLVVVTGMDPVGLLYGFGLFALLTAVVYRRPIPVQPMKAAAAMGIAGLISADALIATAILMGVILIALSQTGSIEWLKRMVPKTVLHGMRLALAASLLGLLFNDVQIHWIGVLCLTAALIGLLQTPLAGFGCLFVVGAGWWIFGEAIPLSGVSSEWAWPSIRLPNVADFQVGLTEAVLPQLALTLTNALILTAVIAKEYFPEDAERITESRLALTSGVANLFFAPIGAMPMCHGAGGLAAHRGLGARTGLSIAIFGGTCLLVAGLFGSKAIVLLASIPAEVLATLLIYAAWVLADPVSIARTRMSCQILIVAMVPVAMVFGLMAALVFGVLADRMRVHFMRRVMI
jgi:hypothetical protein